MRMTGVPVAAVVGRPPRPRLVLPLRFQTQRLVEWAS
eukprot:13228.XXX_613414_613524_1 [CDS] Oithona nana genome sequencing.